MVGYIMYGFYNLIYQAVSLWLLLYASAYVNGFFIPDSLRWKDGKLREDLTAYTTVSVIILIVEAALLILLIYYINMWYLSSVVKVSDPNRVAKWTAGVYALITLGLIVFTTYPNFK